MSILVKIAWRNVWRNTRRSGVLISAVAVGVFCLVGMTVFMDGMAVEMLNSSIDMQGGHLQVAAEGYQENPVVRSFIQRDAVATALQELDGVRYAPVVAMSGMVTGAEKSSGGSIQGIDPRLEPEVTTMANKVVAGTYLTPEGGGKEVLIGAAMADRLNVRLGEKVVLMVNDLHNEISAGAYRVVGLYRTSSRGFDEGMVYIHIDEAQRLLGYAPGQLSSIAVRLADPEALDAVEATLEARLEGEGLEVLSWKERNPFLEVAMQMYDYSVIILALILFTAVAFTIINTFLMVILERIREIGIMMANGVRPQQVRLMLYLEAIFVALVGIAVGTGIAAVLVTYWSINGLDLTAFADGLNEFGLSAVVYPYINWFHLGLGFTVVILMIVVAVLYPAFKASRYHVVEAINHV